MPADLFLQTMGIYMIAMAIGIIMQFEWYHRLFTTMRQEPMALLMAGFVLIAVSVPLVVLFRDGASQQEFVAWVLALLMLTKGLVFVAFPGSVSIMSETLPLRAMRWPMAIISAGVGLYLVWFAGGNIVPDMLWFM